MTPNPSRFRAPRRTSPIRALVRSVIILTLPVVAGCGIIGDHVGESCNSRAHIAIPLLDHIQQRFGATTPVRMAVIPPSVPANFSGRDDETASFSVTLASRIHQEVFGAGEIPIVEVFNRVDWPRKKEEYFSGNFGSISMAREAGYDLIYVGFLDPMVAADRMTLHSKIIEVESGITLWYADQTVVTRRPELRILSTNVLFTKHKPAYLYSNELTDALIACVRESFVEQELYPGE